MVLLLSHKEFRGDGPSGDDDKVEKNIEIEDEYLS